MGSLAWRSEAALDACQVLCRGGTLHWLGPKALVKTGGRNEEKLKTNKDKYAQVLIVVFVFVFVFSICWFLNRGFPYVF